MGPWNCTHTTMNTTSSRGPGAQGGPRGAVPRTPPRRAGECRTPWPLRCWSGGRGPGGAPWCPPSHSPGTASPTGPPRCTPPGATWDRRQETQTSSSPASYRFIGRPSPKMWNSLRKRIAKSKKHGLANWNWVEHVSDQTARMSL